MSDTAEFRREDYEALLQRIEAALLAIAQPYGRDKFRNVLQHDFEIIIAALRLAAQKEPKQ